MYIHVLKLTYQYVYTNACFDLVSPNSDLPWLISHYNLVSLTSMLRNQLFQSIPYKWKYR